MDIKTSGWHENLICALKGMGIGVEYIPSPVFALLRLNNSERLLLNLISIHHHLPPDKFVQLQEEWKKTDTQVVHLWEDIWSIKSYQVLSRIASILGMNKTVHGRKTKIIPVTQELSDTFFNQHHLQGSARCKYRLALQLDNEIVAIAGFSGTRRMTRRNGVYNSVELIRFATVSGITVTGGLSKLIKHFIKMAAPNDVMSYADLDWSLGQGYAKLGFQCVAQTPPMQILLNEINLQRVFPHRLPAPVKSAIATMEEWKRENYLKTLKFVPIFNTGNLKYILYL